MTRAIREGRKHPNIPRIPRGTPADQQKRATEDRFYPSRAKDLSLAPLAGHVRGMRGIAKTANPLPLAPNRDPNGLVRTTAARDARDARDSFAASRSEMLPIEMPRALCAPLTCADTRLAIARQPENTPGAGHLITRG